jgi:medium-chain acyl-[acyl-carrier-protein] hydrolase
MVSAGESKSAVVSKQHPVWVESFNVHSYEADFQGNSTLESLCHVFQEAAWNHAEKLGLGYEFLRRQNKLWVLSRLTLRIARLPRWGETFVIHTWPRNAKSAFAFRDFEMFDSLGANLISGASAWLVLDSTSRRPQRIDKLIGGIEGFSDRRALESEPEKLNKVVSQTEPQQRTARYSEVDVNGHVNYARYIGWIMDSYSLDFHRAHTVKMLDVNYLGETVCGERVSLLSEHTEPGEYWHSIMKIDTGNEAFRARVLWNA